MQGAAAAIAVVGPLTNAVIAIVCLVASTVLGSGIPGLVLGGIAFVNGALAVLNLLPGLPLDGGQIVEAGNPDEFFSSPRTERARDFLSKVLSH